MCRILQYWKLFGILPPEGCSNLMRKLNLNPIFCEIFDKSAGVNFPFLCWYNSEQRWKKRQTLQTRLSYFSQLVLIFRPGARKTIREECYTHCITSTRAISTSAISINSFWCQYFWAFFVSVLFKSSFPSLSLWNSAVLYKEWRQTSFPRHTGSNILFSYLNIPWTANATSSDGQTLRSRSEAFIRFTSMTFIP